MHPTFKKIKEEKCDAISFLPSPDKEDETTILGLTYKDKGDNIGGSELGHSYDILTFKITDDDCVKDHFEAILVCPYTYSEQLMTGGHFGLIAKRTTTSDDMVARVSKSIDKLIAQYNENE